LASTVEEYLAELRTCLAGTDPALVQDALYDAEEYLRDAVAEAGDTPEAFTGVIERYGSPVEIAAAYRDREVTVAAALRRPVPSQTARVLGFFSVLADPSAWGALFYMVLALATGIAYFTVVVTGLSMTVGLAILIIGIPFALLFIAMVRAISLAEGRIVEGLLGVRMPRRPRSSGRGGTLIERIKAWLGDYRTWTTMLYMALQLPLGIAYFTVVVTGIALSLSLIALPFVQLFVHEPMFVWNGANHVLQPWAMPFAVALGALGLVVMLWVAKGVGHLHGLYAKTMLVGNFEGAVLPSADGATPGQPGPPAIVTPPAPPAEPASAEPASGQNAKGD
jgi:uncharacterized membrane protein